MHPFIAQDEALDSVGSGDSETVVVKFRLIDICSEESFDLEVRNICGGTERSLLQCHIKLRGIYSSQRELFHFMMFLLPHAEVEDLKYGCRDAVQCRVFTTNANS